MSEVDPDWTALRTGHDWRDETILGATRWLRSFVVTSDMERRLAAVRLHLAEHRERVRSGEPVAFKEPSDLAAWHIFQAEAYAADRMIWEPEPASRIVPFFARIGEELALLQTVGGVETRAARLMLEERRQPEAGIFELLVGLAYRRSGWAADFVPETRGRGQTPDLLLNRGRSSWAAECKRMTLSDYAKAEKVKGEALARPVHAMLLERGLSVVVQVHYDVELLELPADYLVERVRETLDHPTDTFWEDEFSRGFVRGTTWEMAQRILAKDDVYFGSSRMIEIFAGAYDHQADHSFAGRWRPARMRPAWAEAVYQASVVSWHSLSPTAIQKKARHFRQMLVKADGQLPPDRPGVLHLGMVSPAGGAADGTRHFMNWVQARTFEPQNPRFRWAYGHYFVPEVTTRRDESWAMTETVAPYKIGQHSTRRPFADAMLLTPPGQQRHGVHWDSSITW